MRTLALTSLILGSLAVACGGAPLNDSSSDDLAYGEPMSWVTLAYNAATQYAANPQLMHIEGTAGAKAMTWQFTFRGEIGHWVTVATDGKTTSIVKSWSMIETPLFMSAIDASTVKIKMTKLKGIASHYGCSSMKSVELVRPLTQSPNAHWSVESGAKSVLVDAVTGAVL
jgi:hypothetical protein